MKKAVIIGTHGHYYQIGDVVKTRPTHGGEYICYPFSCNLDWSSRHWQVIQRRDLLFLPLELNPLTHTL
jgi:hypothetical protein